MRSSAIVTLLLCSFAAAPLAAEVRLITRADGRKVIYNVPSSAVKKGKWKGSELTWLAKQHDRATSYDPLIARYSRLSGVDPLLVKAVIQVESNFNAACVSNKGARGLMQLMPATARRFGVKQMHDPEENIRGGIAYLAVLQRLFPDDLHRVLAAYNAGEGAVKRYGGIPPYEETQTYVRRALTVLHGRPYGSISVAPALSFAGRKGAVTTPSRALLASTLAFGRAPKLTLR